MFEDCYQSLARLRQAQVPVGKIQLSNAMICRLPTQDALRREHVLNTLSTFTETTYLHQVKPSTLRPRHQLAGPAGRAR